MAVGDRVQPPSACIDAAIPAMHCWRSLRPCATFRTHCAGSQEPAVGYPGGSWETPRQRAPRAPLNFNDFLSKPLADNQRIRF